MPVILHHEAQASIVTLDFPPMNLLNIENIDQIVSAHQEADAHPETRAIITRSALPEMFSNGLDPMAVLRCDDPGRVEVFKAVARLLHGLGSLGKPHIAALNGPAMAGGAILAVTADFRFIDRDKGRFCFSEPKVGLPIPAAVIAFISHFCDPRALREIAYFGTNMKAQDALQYGMADAIADHPQQMDELIAKQVSRISRLSPSVLRTSKTAMRKNLLQLSATFLDDLGSFAPFVGDDFLGEGLRALVENRQPQFLR